MVHAKEGTGRPGGGWCEPLSLHRWSEVGPRIEHDPTHGAGSDPSKNSEAPWSITAGTGVKIDPLPGRGVDFRRWKHVLCAARHFSTSKCAFRHENGEKVGSHLLHGFRPPPGFITSRSWPSKFHSSRAYVIDGSSSFTPKAPYSLFSVGISEVQLEFTLDKRGFPGKIRGIRPARGQDLEDKGCFDLLAGSSSLCSLALRAEF